MKCRQFRCDWNSLARLPALIFSPGPVTQILRLPDRLGHQHLPRASVRRSHPRVWTFRNSLTMICDYSDRVAPIFPRVLPLEVLEFAAQVRRFVRPVCGFVELGEVLQDLL